MMLAGSNDQQQQGAPLAPPPPAKAAIVPAKTDEGGLPWGWIALVVVGYLAWGYMKLLKEQERRDRKRYYQR